MKSNFASFKSFCSKSIDCTKCPLGRFKKSISDCKRLHEQAITNEGNITVNISESLKG